MHILIANDDGYNAPGLLILAEALRNQHHKVSIVAPRENVSGCGMGLSLRRSVHVEELADDMFIVDGTPADCVYIGLQNLVTSPVDVVMSGINNGANLGDDIYYSGTFAAAMEARRLGLPSVAVSITAHDVDHYETAAYIAVQLSNALPHLKYQSLLAVLNVNIPDIPVANLRGFKATALSERLEPMKPIEEARTEKSRRFRLAPAGDFDRRKRGYTVDFEAVEQGFVSVTPLTSKLDDRAYLKDVQEWLESL